ncbi:MAG TPA: hypothetical protein VIY29_07660 [Ktedonobacteraceae bacterium]
MPWGLRFPTSGLNLSPGGTLLVVIVLLVGLYLIVSALLGRFRMHGVSRVSSRSGVLEQPSGDGQVYKRTGRKMHIYARAISALCGLVLILLALFVVTVGGALEGIRNLTSESPVALVHATTIVGLPHKLSVEVKLLDDQGNITSDQTYLLDGDLWELKGEFFKLQTWVNFLGFHSGFKVVRLSGDYLDVNLQNKGPHNDADINGGYGDFFNHIVQKDSPLRIFADANYGTAVFNPAGTYKVVATNSGFIARTV